jgi:hypothetical protein
MPSRLRWTLLCEDRTHERFFRTVARKIFLRDGKVLVAPSGRGAASQWVLNATSNELANVRRRARERVGLLIVIDGDNLGLDGRITQIQEAVSAAGAARIEDNEPVAICVPCWSIETWLLHLSGTAVTEQQSYKSTATYHTASIDPRSVSDEMFRLVQGTSAATLPSLEHARTGFTRLRALLL